MAEKKEAISLFSVVAENLSSNELGLKTKKENHSESSENVRKKIAERIEEFHNYLEGGMSLEKAQKIILDSTIYNEVKQYVNLFVDEQKNKKPLKQDHNCEKELSEILSEVKSLTREIESYKNRMIVIETRIKNLMEDH